MFNLPRRHFEKIAMSCVCLVFLVFCFVFPATSAAEVATLDEFEALGEKFDHLTTGYALVGEHNLLDCGECHIGGVFEALPKECEACHDNVIASGKPSNHVETNAPCDTCHTTSGFIATAVMDHSIIAGSCASCHDGVSATGKAVDHINTGPLCEVCHNTNFWTPVPNEDVDHSQVRGTCVTCHNGTISVGKSAAHLPASDVCEACHLATGDDSWPLVCGSIASNPLIDHSQVFGPCSFCHDGILAEGKNATHIPTALECNACHSVPSPSQCVKGPQNWGAEGIAFDHSTVQGQACDGSGCHDGVNATGKTAGHIDTSNRCEACHQAGVNWTSTYQVDHHEVNGTCASCHTKPAGHINTTDLCDECHDPAPSPWTTIVTDKTVFHAQVLGDCSTCHNGTDATGKNNGHISSSNQCGACHSTSAWIPVNQVDHTQVNGSCFSCHNGNDATGKNAGHIDTSDACEACHSSTSWRPVVRVDHNEINNVNQCASCHDKPGGHPITSDNCSVCHTNFTDWGRIRMSHNEVPAGSCSSCHNGSIAPGKNQGHCSTNQECDVCHTSTSDWGRTSRGC